jgi:hypothetical protein
MDPRRYRAVDLALRFPALAAIVQADNKGSWTWKDEVMSKMKPGDIVEITAKPDQIDGGAYITIIPEVGKSAHQGFHYYASDDKGNLTSERKRGVVNHSNMFFKNDEMKIVGHRDGFKEHEYQGFKWIQTGIEQVDSELANVDDRFELFQKFAPARLQEIYQQQESRNYHQENQALVEEFAEHLASGGSPNNFSYEEKEESAGPGPGQPLPEVS